MEDAEDGDGDGDADGDGDEEEEQPEKIEQTILCGRIFNLGGKSTNTDSTASLKSKESEKSADKPVSWVFEKWNKIVTSDKFPEIQQRLATLHKSILQEEKSRKRRVEEAKQAVIKAAEERKAMIAAATAKKKAGTKTKKGAKEEPPKDDEEQKQDIKPKKVEKRELDLTNPTDFIEALKERAPRRFTFGPIEFSGLTLTNEQEHFDGDKVRQLIIDQLDNCMGEPHICIHGYLVEIKGRTVKRRSTMLKHGRFLPNLIVSPVYPAKIFVEENDDEDGEGDDAAGSAAGDDQ